MWNVVFLTAYLPKEFETKLIGGKCTQDEGDALNIFSEHGIEVTLIDTMSREISLKNDWKAFREIKKIIKNYQPHIVHTHASKSGLIGRLAAIQMKVPIIVHTFHGHVFEGYFSKNKSIIIQYIERWLSKRSDAIIAISDLQKKDLTGKFKIAPEEKVHVVPLGFNLHRFYPSTAKRTTSRQRFQLGDGVIAVGIVGRLTAIKNHRLFLQAAAIVLKNSELDYKFFIVGDGELKESLEELTLQLKIENKVNLTSWISDMENFYAAMDIVCLTAINEGTPVTLIESQASAVPVISTNVGGISDIVRDKVTGILLETMNPSEMADKIEYLSKQEFLRIQMSKNAHKFASENFTHQQLVNNMERVYQKLINRNAS